MEHLMSKKESYTALTYVASGNTLPRETTFGCTKKEGEELKIQILTPQFYSDVVSARSIAEYLESIAAGPAIRRTFVCERLADFVAVVQDQGARFTRPTEPRLWRFLASLRTPPSASTANELDVFVLNVLPDSEPERYRRSATAQLLANKLTLGVPALLDAAVGFIRAVAVYFALRGILDIALHSKELSGIASLVTAAEVYHLVNILGNWVLERSGFKTQ